MSNSVRGPTSALTSFLREKGIRIPRSNGWPMSNITQDQTTDPVSLGDTGSVVESASNVILSSNQSSFTQQEIAANAVSSQSVEQLNLEASVDSLGSAAATDGLDSAATTHGIETSAGGVRNSSVEQQILSKSKSKALLKQKKPQITMQKRKRPVKDDSDKESQESDANPLAPRQNYSKRNKKEGNKETTRENQDYSVFKTCENCYRRMLDDVSSLCSACINFPSSKHKKKRRVVAGRKLKSDVNEESEFQSLKFMCIKVIAQNIEYVEQFGNLTSETRVKISQIISRHRQLNSNTLKLFLDANEERIELFDCTRINQDDLLLISQFCPHATNLTLRYCGRMVDDVIIDYSNTFTRLKHLTLTGCFLVTDNAFTLLFSKLGSGLDSLTLGEAARLSLKSVQTLCATGCKNLKSLKLKRCHSLTEECYQALQQLDSLNTFKLIEPGTISNQALIDLLKSIGSGLSELSLSGIEEVCDDVLLAGIEPLTHLEKLSLNGCHKLSNDGLLSLFSNIKSKRLSRVSLGGVVSMKDDSLAALFNLTGQKLEKLCLNGLDELSEHAFDSLFSLKTTNITHLDVSWIRSIDDEIFKRLIDSMPSLVIIKVYGCNKLTLCSLDRDWKNALNNRIKVLGNEFD